MVNRAEELITQLEAEIVKRDARIAELESERNRLLNNPKDVFKKMCGMALKQRDEFAAELAALKAQQPSAGVVLPERMTWDGLRATACNIRGEGWNACLDEVAHLNSCRAQAVPDGYVVVPVEPTQEMLDAGSGPTYTYVRESWSAMLAAAPSAKKESER